MNRRHFIELGIVGAAAAGFGLFAARQTPRPKYKHYRGCGGETYEDDTPETSPPIQCGMAMVSPRSQSFIDHLTEQRFAAAEERRDRT